MTDQHILSLARAVAARYTAIGYTPEDLAQEAMLAMLALRRRLAGATLDDVVLTRRLIGVARRHLLRLSRRVARNNVPAKPLPASLPAKEQSLPEGIDSRQLFDFAWSKLTQTQAEAIELYYHQSWTDREIGDHFGVSESAVLLMRHRALKRLRKLIEGPDGQSDS